MGILKKNKLFFLLILILVTRLAFIILPSFKIDMNDWQAWSARLVELMPLNFYSPDYFSDYFPGYLYILWFLGSSFHLLFPQISIFSPGFEYYLKFFTNIFDVATAYFIYKIVTKYQKGVGWQAAIFYLANPALLFNSSVWGQVDGILTFFLILSTYYLFELKNAFKFSVVFALSILVKPQGLAIFPVLLSYLVTHLKPSKMFSLLMIPTLLIILSLPFFLKDPILSLLHLFQKSAGTYPYTAMFSYNLWSFVGWWIPDSTKFLNITYQLWGIIIYFVFLTLILTPLFINYKLKNKEIIYFALALATFAFFLFLTRMHERYLYPFFAFLLAITLIQNSIKLKVIYSILSFIHFINLWHVYYYYNYVFQNPKLASFFIYQYLSNSYNWLTLINLTSFGILMGIYLKRALKIKKSYAQENLND